MSEYIIYPNAPIVEAILDIKFKLPEGEDSLKKLEKFQKTIEDRFPKKTIRRTQKAGLQFSSEKAFTVTPSSSEILGYISNDPIEDRTVQARLDGYTYNKLKPYDKWDVFREEGRELWNLYLDIVQPEKIERIALRYINRIEVPMPMNSFEEYFKTFPQLATGLPQTLSHFFIQFVIPCDKISAYARVTLTVEKPTNDKKLPIIFDIDVFRDVIYVDNKEEIWEDFEKMRAFKNDVFFKSITAKTEELFK